MPANHRTPEQFEIEAASPQFCDPEDGTYVVCMRLQGTYEVRSFLSDNGVDERRIAFAIEELGRSRRVSVKNQPEKASRIGVLCCFSDEQDKNGKPNIR